MMVSIPIVTTMTTPKLAPRTLRPTDYTNPKPVYAVWEITLRCDHACAHCGSRADTARPNELTTAELIEVADQLIRIGTREVTLIGGEAYLRSDVYELVKYLSDAGIYVAMQSGGLGLTERRLEKLKEAGLRGIGISIDGPAHVHDVLRDRQGSWQAGMNALKKAQKLGFILTSNTQVNQLTLPHLRETMQEVRKTGVRVWRVQLTVPMGRAADRPEWLLQPYQMIPLLDEMAQLKLEVLQEAYDKGIPPQNVMNITLGNNVGYYGQHEHLLRSAPGIRAKVWAGCQAGKFALGIESDGTIKGCPSLPTAPYVGGNIRDLTLEQLWETPELRFVRDRDESELWGHCSTCYYASACRGGCSFTTHCFFQRRGNNPFCYYRAQKLKEQGIRETVRQIRPAEGIPYDFGQFEIVEEPW